MRHNPATVCSLLDSLLISVHDLIRQSGCATNIKVLGNNRVVIGSLGSKPQQAGPTDVFVALGYDAHDPLPDIQATVVTVAG